MNMKGNLDITSPLESLSRLYVGRRPRGVTDLILLFSSLLYLIRAVTLLEPPSREEGLIN